MQKFPNEINMRLAQEMDAMMSMMNSQVNRAISSTISERVLFSRDSEHHEFDIFREY